MMLRFAAVFVFLAGCGEPGEGVPPAPVQDDGDFEPFGEPKPGDWQYRFREKPQSYDDYVRYGPNRSTDERHTFYIQPLGKLSKRHRGTIEAMCEYAETYFTVEAKIREPIPIPSDSYSRRRDQYDASMIIRHLSRRVPDDAIVYIGILDRDLYSEGLNYVFGEGNLRERTGVYSLVRYESRDETLFLRRSLKLMTHEVGHIFSVLHCVTYRCVMNGANSLAEHDRHPMHLCPIDLRKLKWNLRFDVVERYRKLHDFYKKHGLEPEAAWTARRLKKLNR